VRTDWKQRLGVCAALSLLCLTVMSGAPAFAQTVAPGVPSAGAVTAELDVQNNLITDNGNPAQRFDFSFQINGGPEIQFDLSGINVLFLDVSQTYTITGVPKDGFTTSYSSMFTCDNVTLDVNVPHLCRITNDDIPPPTTTTTTTTTTTMPSTTTTPRAGQTQVHGSGVDVNHCSLVLNPALQPDSRSDITVTLASDASPQPHLGDPITLSNTTLGLSIPAKLIQAGVDVGLITDGFKVPAHITLVVAGSHTTQQTHQYVVDATATIHVTAGGPHGKALPLALTVPLPDTSWTPANGTDDVLFSQKSMTIVSAIDLNPQLSVVATFTCEPANGSSFVALGATGAPVTTTTTPTTPTTTPTSSTTAVTVAQAAELPRTGSTPWPLLVLAAGCIDLGLLALAGAKRGRRRLADR
jgi:hypothetical protein